MAEPDWEDQCLQQSGIERVFLTNDFDDPLEGFNTERYIPCLRTDDLVFHLSKPEVRTRMSKATGIEIVGGTTLRRALGKLFELFRDRQVDRVERRGPVERDGGDRAVDPEQRGFVGGGG